MNPTAWVFFVSIQSQGMPCHVWMCVCVWLAYDHHQVPYEYESIYIYIYYIRTVLTIQTITSAIWRDKVFPSQLLPIPLSSCDWAATQLAKHPPVTQSLGMIHPGRLPMSIMRRLIDILGIKLVRLNPFWSSFIGHCLCHVEHCSALQSSLNSTHQVFSRRWQTIPQIQMIHRIKQMQ